MPLDVLINIIKVNYNSHRDDDLFISLKTPTNLPQKVNYKVYL